MPETNNIENNQAMQFDAIQIIWIIMRKDKKGAL